MECDLHDLWWTKDRYSVGRTTNLIMISQPIQEDIYLNDDCFLWIIKRSLHDITEHEIITEYDMNVFFDK